MATDETPPTRPKRPRRFRHLPNVLRLAAFCAFVSCVVAAFTVRALAGNVRDGMMSLGREMMRYTDRGGDGPVQRLSINGAELEFATGETHDPVSRVLDVYERRCASRDGAVARQIAALSDARPHASDAAVAQHGMTTLRAGTERAGFVSCVDVGEARLSPGEILRRLRAFGASGNIADVGRMRYLYAEQAAPGRTRFIGFWSDGDVNVQRMFPAQGDAPGSDVPSVPRGPGLRRMLSAFQVGQTYALDIYAGPAPRAQLEDFYRDAMPRNGWTLIPVRGAPEVHGQAMLTYEKGATTVSLVFAHADHGAATVTVLAGM